MKNLLLFPILTLISGKRDRYSPTGYEHWVEVTGADKDYWEGSEDPTYVQQFNTID